MFLNDVIRRRLSTVLQPWLRGDQELELKLGILRSNATLNNTSLNITALNELLDDPSRFCFKEATVEYLSLQFSPFSPVAFTIVARGLRVVLSLGEEEDEGGGKWMRKPRDTTVDEKNKFLEEIDPEGCALHDAIKKIADITTRTWVTSILESVFRHSHLQLHGVHVLLQSPCLHDSFSCSLYMKELGAGSRIIGQRGFVRGMMSSFLMPFEESSFKIDVDCFEIKLDSESHTSCVLPATNMFALVKSNHLQSLSLCFHLPAMNISFSPSDLSVILLLCGLMSKENKCPRTGRQLWNIVATKINSLCPTSKLPLIQVVKVACLWLRYINTYQSILLLVGYPADEKMRRSATLMFRDTSCSRTVRSQWNLIAEIENNLPLHTIAVARRIIRHRVASRDPDENQDFGKLLSTGPFSKWCQLFVGILSMIGALLVSFMKILFLHKLVNFSESRPGFGSVHENPILQQRVTLKIEEISVFLSPDIDIQPSVSGNAFLGTKISLQHLQAFNFSIDAFYVRYMVNISEKCYTFASGRLKVFSSKAGASGYAEEQWTKEVDNRKIVVWGEPAQILLVSDATSDNATTSVPHLGHLLGKLWLNWKYSCSDSEGENIPNVQAPWILVDIRSNLKDHINCGLVVGKLNFNLGYYTFASTVVLIRQIQSACWSSRGKNVVCHSSAITIEDPPVRYCSKITSFFSQIEMSIMRMLPEKHVQIGALIAGPHILISLLKDQFNPHHLVTQVSFEFCNIELLVSPNLDDNFGLSGENTEFLGLKELKEFDISKSDNGAYSCQGQFSTNAYLKVNGLKAYVGGPTENKKHETIVLQPKTTTLSYVRKDHHAFASSVVAVSAAFHCVAAGFSCLLFLDELYVLTKIVSEILDQSLAFTVNGSGGNQSYEEVSSRETNYSESECGQTSFVRSKQSSLITSPQVFVDSNCELNSFEMVFHHSRKSCSQETCLNPSMIPHEREAARKPTIHDTSNNGVHISMQHLMMEFMFNGRNLDVVIDTTGVRCMIFKYLTEFDGTSHKSELNNLSCSSNFLTEASVYRSKLCFYLRKPEKALPPASLHTLADESSSHWLSTTIVLSGIYMAGCLVKDILVDQLEELNASFSVGGEFQAISCECKGGSVILEAAAVTMFIECFALYYQKISELWPSGLSSGKAVVPQYVTEIVPLDSHNSTSPQQVQCREVMWDCLEEFSTSLSHFSLVLMERDESGRLHELLFEVNSHFSLKLLDTVRKISLSISKFSMLARTRQKPKVTQSPFSSTVPDDSKTSFISKDCSPSPQHSDSIQHDLADSGPSTSVSYGGSHVGISTSNPGQKNPYISLQKYILTDLRCFLAVEGPMTEDQITPYSNNIWVGSGSLSGFDMTISLFEINMLLSAFESCSKVLSREGTAKVESRHWTYNPEAGGSMGELVPDGSVVVIQDVDQHMYIAVEAAESGYDVAGAIHYSLVGERALFRVKYHKPRRWESKVQYFSLISLHNKDNSGEPLQLSCRPRSRFVDISSSSDSGSALWRMLPFTPDAYEDAIELESSISLSKRTFHLVNKKNDCAVAFTDGILEFVNKPGNLFKWKVFDDPAPVGNNLSPNSSLMEVGNSQRTGSDFQNVSNVTGVGKSTTNQQLSGITIAVDKVLVTIVHELSDTEEKFPLLQGSILPNQAIIQFSNLKLRVINTFEVILYYFDAQQNSWKEFIQPLEICIFYSQKFLVEGVENCTHGVPSHLYAKIKEVSVSLSEVSLDILLLVIGKLDLAGPYAVKSSVVLANCCKVTNQTGLTLICQFYDNQDASVSARQSTTIYLSAPSFGKSTTRSIFLFSAAFTARFPFNFSNSSLTFRSLPIRLEDPHCIIASYSKSFPGPFIVLEVSKGIEDGLSIAVAPLLKIQNETDFSLELRFHRPHHEETESVSLVLKAGDIVDDSMTAFSAVDLSGGLRKALTSLSVGNYVFSFRPNIADSLKFEESSVEWSDDLKGGKPVRLSGVFDKLSYQVQKAFSVNKIKSSLNSVNCAIKSKEGSDANMYFLIKTVGKAIPVVNPDSFGYAPGTKNSPVAMQEQKEIFVLPTVQVSNLLHTEIHVRLTDKDPQGTSNCHNKWSQATISCGSAANFYANPATIYFVVTLTSFGLSCNPVNSSDWVRKLQKQKVDISHLDIELEFGSGKYFAMLRLSRGHRGMLQAGVFTSYALQNDTDVPLFCFSANQKPLSRVDMERLGTGIPPELGSHLPPSSITSWFLKSHKLRFKLLEDKAVETPLDLDVLSGLTEIDLETEEFFGSKDITRLGVSLRPSLTEVSSQIVSLNPRYVVCNESEDTIALRQCNIEGVEELINISSKQRIALKLKSVSNNKKETNFVENILRKHTKSQNDLTFFIQFRPNGTGLGWSGPVCVASLGRFFLKFRKSLEYPDSQSAGLSYKDDLGGFAVVHVVEEGSTIVLHFHRPPLTNLPYRIENLFHGAPLTYYQKGSSEPDILGAGVAVNYVWDDLTLPHKLVIQLDDVHMLREINLDKVRSWKPFYRSKQTRGLGFHLPLNKKPEDLNRTSYGRLIGADNVKVGYEVYAEGVTRVLRICEFSDSHKVDIVPVSGRKMRLRVSYISVHLLENYQQEVDLEELSMHAPIIITRLERFSWDAILTDQQKYIQIRVQSLSVDEKWAGAPFAAMLRHHQSEKSDANDYILHVAVVLLPTSSSVKHVKYLSIVLQPLDLNFDEETLMKIVPFWRRSLSDSSGPRQQYYFDHFEIHPIKIVASFLPGDSRYSYSSTQETLRSLLHSVIKIPVIKTKTVELNGVLVTHALITYAMRAIYIAKGSPLLPPAFASIFDDLASSSLDVFFDPSSGTLNIPGVTLGTLKLISKVIDNKGFTGTKRYFGDLGKTLQKAGSNILFAAVTEVSDSVLKGAETKGFNGMVSGFHQGILKLAMEPSVLSSAFMEGGSDRKIKLDRSPGIDELYIEGYLQAMLDTMYKQEYLRVRVIENQVVLKNLPPSSSLINEIMENVKGFLASKSLLKGEPSSAYSLRYLRGEREWRIGPTVLTLCEHLFVSFMIRLLRKQSSKAIGSRIKWKEKSKADEEDKAIVSATNGEEQKVSLVWKWGIGKFFLSGIVAYIDGRLCRNIPNPLARRIVSGFLLSFLDQSDDETK
ncbi:hypothetical protein CASFOL_039843 [Castilleja foliolosa]|uniref:Vacuolar protein sorting-associated protein 13 VPS13 adaptor binding domain-containing protein n=1 Tax=Castilleja foliolosa TaxID=1961234 RepID=A0ABD3BGC5_9LAMI